MDSSNKRITQRPRRPRTVPPPGPTPSSLPPYFRLEDEVPRFVGQSAPLASLAVQVRSASGKEEKASAAQRLARQLVRRGIETREAIGLAEKSLSLHPEPELALDLAGWWVSAGDLIRGAALRHAAVEGLPAARKVEELLGAAQIHARAGQVIQATQALHQAMALRADDARAWEVHGSFGFWSDLPEGDCTRSYLRAAELRQNAGQEGPAFENLLHAFELSPSSEAAAQRLAIVLRGRGRPGAADEVLREHLRNGSAAKRAAFHQRAFYAAVVEGNVAAALESGLEAELDVELDADRLESLLKDPPARSSDFEGLLIELSTKGESDGGPAFAQWLLSLISVHLFDWGEARVGKMLEMARARLQLQGTNPPQLPADLSDPQALRSLRRKIAEESDPIKNRQIREQVALREVAQGQWGLAYEVLQPLIEAGAMSASSAVLSVVVASRARKPLGRARALRSLGRSLPLSTAAVLHAVAAEMLLKEGAAREARDTAAEALLADPRSERALASQALVALGAPETASSGLLERSLSVLVARAEACALLCRSAADSGSPHLALSWATRRLALRPGDLVAIKAYLDRACATEDPERILEALRLVIQQSTPFAPLFEDIARALRALSTLNPEEVEKIGTEVIENLGVRADAVIEPLVELAKARGASALLATITERQLVTAPPAERAGLSLVLCRRRLRAGQFDAAARALRRALAQGADIALVRESVQSFEEPTTGDGQLAMLEIETELLDRGASDYNVSRAHGLRRVAAARFDMAQDTVGAVQFLLKAAEIDTDRGLELLAHYLHHLAGPDAAAEHLKSAAGNTEDPMRSGRLLGFAARELYESGRFPEAFRLSVQALERAPLLTELLSIAESCATTDQVNELLDLYALLARSSLGCYGERAVHYHAARELDRRGYIQKALEHAVLAFEAVPAEGVAFVLMVRLAESTNQLGTVIASLERTAEAATRDEDRARWLARAASLADPDALGRGQRVSILIRAAQMTPDEHTFAAYLDALAHLLADEPDSKDALWESFFRLATETLRHANGAFGAQLAVILAAAAVTHFDKADFALTCLGRAVECDIEIPDYDRLISLAFSMSALKESTHYFVNHVREVADRRNAPLGGGLARLAGRLAELIDLPSQKSELLVRAASDFPEDSELVALARLEAKQQGRDDLLQEIEGLLPVAEQVQSVLERLPALSTRDGLVALLSLDLDSVNDDSRAELLQKMGERQEELGEFDEAVLTYREAFELKPESESVILGLERDAERRGNHEEVARLLRVRSEQTTDVGVARRLILRRATVLETKLGRAAEAREILSALVERTEDHSALRMLADSWERAGDYAEAAELWMRVQEVAADSASSDDACYRAAACFLESGAPRRAGEALDKILNPNIIHRTLALEVARTLGKKEGVLKQIIALAQVMVGDGAQQGELYLEAARLALSLGDGARARYCSMNARRLLPKSSEACLMELRLQFQKAPPIDVESARVLLQEIEGTQQLSFAADREIREYIRAQALLLTDSRQVALRSLEAAIEEQGPRPLLSLALADLGEADDRRSLSLYESAVGAELHGFFGEGEVLVRAGRVARNLGDFDRARAFLSAVAEGDPARSEALVEQVAIASSEEEIMVSTRAIALEAVRRAQEEEKLERDRTAKEEAELKLAEEAQEARRLAAEEVARQEVLALQAAEAERGAALHEEELERRATIRRLASEEAAAERRLAAARAAKEEAERLAAEGQVRAAHFEREARESAARRFAAERAAADAVLRQQAAEREERAKGEQSRQRALAEKEAQRLAAEAAVEKLEAQAEIRKIEGERQILLQKARESAAAETRRQLQFEEQQAEILARERRIAAEEASRRVAAEEAIRREVEEVQRAADAARDEEENQAEVRRHDLLESARAEHRRASLAASEQHEQVLSTRRAILSSRPSASADASLEEAARIGVLAPPRVPLLSEEEERAFDLVPSQRQPQVDQGVSVQHFWGKSPPTIGEEIVPASLLPEDLVATTASQEEVVPAFTVPDHLSPTSTLRVEQGPESVPFSFLQGKRPPSRHPPKTNRTDDNLVNLLDNGDVDAGLELLDRIQEDRSRVREALLVAQHLVALEPGDASILGRLVTTASRDGNHALALAVRHILGAYGAGDAKVAPPIASLHSQGSAVRALFNRGATSPMHEALAIVWEHTSGHYKREIANYGVSGVERVPHSTTTPFGVLAREAAGILGLERTAVFRQATSGDVRMQVALLAPPAVIVSGDVDVEAPEMSFHFGAMLAAATPEHALLYGAEEAELNCLLLALGLSFGSGDSSPASRPDPVVTRVASLFWEAIPARSQRRLSQLCAEAENLNLEALTASSRRVLRRAGFIVCGDLPTAVADACQEFGRPVPTNLAELAESARASAAVADLLTLAVSPEYAEIRFREA